MSHPPHMREPTLQLSLPEDGITDGDVVLRFPTEAHIDGLLAAVADPELREAANMPNVAPEQARASIAHLPALMASGRMLAMTALDARTGDVVGGGILHHLDAERGIVEIGYWVLPHARGRGIATQIARLLAEHAFALGSSASPRMSTSTTPRPSACSSARASRARGSSGRCRRPTAGASTRRCSRCCPASERAADAGRARRPEGRRARLRRPRRVGQARAGRRAS
jgi:RimJ/RimL family protein N-acetyltransferase